MKRIVINLLAAAFAVCSMAQTVPADSLYLGQTPPGDLPKVFNLAFPAGSFVAERIAISRDQREIYYTTIRRYYPTGGDTIRYYRYENDGWTGPFIFLNDHLAPALSKSGDTMFYQNNNPVYETFYSVREGSQWSEPKRILPDYISVHYLQKTDSNRFFVSTIHPSGPGGGDWCALTMNAGDTTAVCLGHPVSSPADNLDFFVARDESFMILAKGGLMVTFPRSDGGWTNPKNLGEKINFGSGMWGPFVTPDHTYLFYSTGTKPDYSDVRVYWVRVDSLLDSLRHSNFIPYLRASIPQQNAAIGRPFAFTVPDTCLVDDDGNQTLKYTAKLSNGSPLPEWLALDSLAGRFSGIPPDVQNLNIRLTATDPSGAYVRTTFRIYVGDTTSVGNTRDHGLLIWPNPARERLNCKWESAGGKRFPAALLTLSGHFVRRQDCPGEGSFDLSDLPRGVYIFQALLDGFPVRRKICLL